jgi:putative addiction module killer protein
MVSDARRRRRREGDHRGSATGVRQLSNVKGVGARVFEDRIDFGPGYRVYFGKDGDAVVILLGGGTKKRQDRDIAIAQERWADYKKRRAREK